MRSTATVRPGRSARCATWPAWAGSRPTARSGITSSGCGAPRTPEDTRLAPMLAEAEVQALLAARHADPFSVLGLHPDGEGNLWLRVVWPGVAAIDVLDAKSGKRLAGLALRDPDG